MSTREVLYAWSKEGHEMLYDIPVTPWEEASSITVVGIPINYPGSHQQTSAVWDNTLHKLSDACTCLNTLGNPQVQYTILSSWLDACKVNQLLRSSNTMALPKAI